ncbi:MAG: hypothetical protein U5R06_17565 [candidate division KSB1 bacterium]|nr:hypothetical protein [candidate division KSB1 bacterium]
MQSPFNYRHPVRALPLLLSSLFLLNSCQVDQGLEPLPGKIAVTINFYNEPPVDTEGIYFMVAPDFPPHAINEMFLSPNSLPIDQDTAYTELALPYGHYEAVALWWYSKNAEANLADVLSIPIDLYTFEPMQFDITPQDPVFEYSMLADWNKVKRESSLAGTVRFNGEFPDNTDITAVAAFIEKPQRPIDYLLFMKSIDFGIKTGVSHYDYLLPIGSGSVGYIAVYWLPQRAGLSEFEVVGEYMDPDNPEQYGRVVPDSGQTITGLDINVNWDAIKN